VNKRQTTTKINSIVSLIHAAKDRSKNSDNQRWVDIFRGMGTLDIIQKLHRTVYT